MAVSWTTCACNNPKCWPNIKKKKRFQMLLKTGWTRVWSLSSAKLTSAKLKESTSYGGNNRIQSYYFVKLTLSEVNPKEPYIQRNRRCDLWWLILSVNLTEPQGTIYFHQTRSTRICLARFWTCLTPVTPFFLLISAFRNGSVYSMPVPLLYLGSTYFVWFQRFKLEKNFVSECTIPQVSPISDLDDI